jgi:nucleoside-diphosphate-sugar epimerase
MIHENEPSSHADGAVCNIYGASKHATRILSEAYAKKIGINFTSFSLANTFGPGDYSSRSTNHFIKKFLENKPIDLTHGAHLYDWIYIDDSIDAIISILEFGKSFKNYYIGRQAIPLKEILFQVKKILNSDSIINLGKYKEDFHVDYKSVDFFQLTKDTGFVNKTPFDKAIINTATWVKSL